MQYLREGCGVTPACPPMCWQVLVFRANTGRQTAGSSRVTNMAVLAREKKTCFQSRKAHDPAKLKNLGSFHVKLFQQNVFGFEKMIEHYVSS